MSGDFVILFLGVFLGYILAEFVSPHWVIAIVSVMLVVAIFYKPKNKGVPRN